MPKTGTVKYYDEQTGYGLILQEGSKIEYSVHISALVEAIQRGDKVCFELHQSAEKIQAINVSIVE